MATTSAVSVPKQPTLSLNNAQSLLESSKSKAFEFEGHVYVAPDKSAAIKDAWGSMTLGRLSGPGPERPDWSTMRELPSKEVTALRARAVEVLKEHKASVASRDNLMAAVEKLKLAG